MSFLKKYMTFIVVFVLFFVAVYFIYAKINTQQLPENLVAGSGRIDGDLTLLNTKYAARVDDILVEEGESVNQNQVIAKLKSQELIDKKNAIEESIKSLKKQKTSYAQTIKAQKLELKLLEKTLPNLVKIKNEELKSLKHSLDVTLFKIQEVQLQNSQNKSDYDRYKELFLSKAISDERFELVELKYNLSKKELASLEVEKKRVKNSIEMAKLSLDVEKSNLDNIDILKQNILASTTKLDSLEDDINQAKASKDEVESMINELTLKSPIDGFVIEKVSNNGEVVGSGGVVVTLSDTSSYYLKLFVDTMQNGKIKIGDKGVIFVDAYPDRPIQAKVTAISAKAEFTPKDVSVRSDRIQRVYAVHLKPLKYDGILKLGIPCVGILTIDGDSLPKSLKDIPEI